MRVNYSNASQSSSIEEGGLSNKISALFILKYILNFKQINIVCFICLMIIYLKGRVLQ